MLKWGLTLVLHFAAPQLLICLGHLAHDGYLQRCLPTPALAPMLQTVVHRTEALLQRPVKGAVLAVLWQTAPMQLLSTRCTRLSHKRGGGRPAQRH